MVPWTLSLPVNHKRMNEACDETVSNQMGTPYEFQSEACAILNLILVGYPSAPPPTLQAVRALGCTAAPLLDVHAYVHAAPGLRSTLLRSCCTFRATDPPQPPNE